MAFQPRTQAEIYQDMQAYLEMHTNLTDFSEGSVARGLLEAASTEDAEQYYQMVQWMDDFSHQNATGTGLDKRGAEWDVTRLQPQQATGSVVILNDALVKSELLYDETPGSLTLELDPTVGSGSDRFPVAGFPYTVRIDEGTTQEEDVSVTANNVATDTLTLLGTTPLRNSHSSGARVAYVSGAADQTIASGLRCRRRAQGGQAAVEFVTTQNGVLVNGNYSSSTIRARALIAGEDGNVGANEIQEFSTAAPFNGAGVTNLVKFDGGRGLETDDEMRTRMHNQIQSLSRSVKTALEQAALGVTDTVTGQRVVTAKCIEDSEEGIVRVYIDDGTGMTPDVIQLANSALSAALAMPGAGSFQVSDSRNFPSAGWLMLEPEGALLELLEYTAVNYATNTITLAGVTLAAHPLGSTVVALDVVCDAAEEGQRFFKNPHWPINEGTFELWTRTGAAIPILKDLGTDYYLNRGTGDIEFTGTGLPSGTRVVSSCTYGVGLLFDVQKILTALPSDTVTYPGYAAAGVQAVVDTPIVRRIRVRCGISAKVGFVESDLRPLVKEAIEAYINGLGIGDNVLKSQIILTAMLVPGVNECIVIIPAGEEVVILENERPVPAAANGTSLVTVL